MGAAQYIARPRPKEVTLAPHHRDVDAPDFTLRTDRDRLLVAGGPQRQIGGKSRGLDEHIDLAAARGALQIVEYIPASLAPVAGNAVTVAGDITAEVEFVAVAGAMKVLLQTKAAAVDLVVGLAADALGRSVGERNRAVAGPCPVETGKRSRLGMACRDGEHQCGADAGSFDRLSKKAGTKPFHIEVSR